MKLSKHFTLEELTVTTHKELKERNRISAISFLSDIEALAFFAEQVRAFIGVPMIISSGYRCEELNQKVGGAKNSQHLFFRAIDFVPKGMGIDECFEKIKSSQLVYHQLIKEFSGDAVWIHVGMGWERENLIYKNGKYRKVK